jgi:very-short-patch-repair endonuclease
MPRPNRVEVLVALLPKRSDLVILREHLWYRIPKDKAPKRWPPRWLALYQPKVFGDDAYSIRFYGRVREIREVPRRILFPDEPLGIKADRIYYQVCLHSLQELEQPIRSTRQRRLLFVPTTWEKFRLATEINDLFDDSPLEDRLWAEMKRLRIAAERQWYVETTDANYALDFAVFCQKGSIDVETDGDTWHADPTRIPQDNARNNALTADGWYVLRFNTAQIRESLSTYCVPKLTDTINQLGGLSDDGPVPRQFYATPGGIGEQLSLFPAD